MVLFISKKQSLEDQGLHYNDLFLTDPADICKAFAQHFASVYDSMPSSYDTSFDVFSQIPSFSFGTIESCEVYGAICNLQAKKAPGKKFHPMLSKPGPNSLLPLSSIFLIYVLTRVRFLNHLNFRMSALCQRRATIRD